MKPTLTEIKHSYDYRIVIPRSVEDKIQFICKKLWNVEWSGILFFTYTGSFEDSNLRIICKDLYIMDIGSTTFTQFKMSPEIISYMTENSELLDCQMGLIH